MNFKYNVFDCICVNIKFYFSNLIKLTSFIPLDLECHLEVSANTFFFFWFIYMSFIVLYLEKSASIPVKKILSN